MVSCCPFLSLVAAQDWAEDHPCLNLSIYPLSAHSEIGLSKSNMADYAYAQEKKSAYAAHAFSNPMKRTCTKCVPLFIIMSFQLGFMCRKRTASRQGKVEDSTTGPRKNSSSCLYRTRLFLVLSFMRLSANSTAEASRLNFISGQDRFRLLLGICHARFHWKALMAV